VSSLSDYEIEVAKHAPSERYRLIMRLGPAHYEEFVILMLERDPSRTVTHCLGVPVVEDPQCRGIRIDYKSAGKR
jgi:hypothetical protein